MDEISNKIKQITLDIIKEYEEAIKEGDTSFENYYGLFLNNKILKKNKSLIDTYAKKALEIGLNEIANNNIKKHTYINLADIYEYLKDDEKALYYYNKAIESYPNNDFAYLQRGHFYNARKKFTLANEDYKQAVKLNPDNTETVETQQKINKVIAKSSQYNLKLNNFTAFWAHNHKINGLIEKINLYFKIQNLKKEIKSGDTSCNAYFELFIAQKQLKNLINYKSVINTSAQNTINAGLKEIENETATIETYIHIAEVYQNINNNEKAKYYYDQAINLYPNNADAYFSRGIYYLERCENELADQNFKKAIELDKEYEEPIRLKKYTERILARSKELLKETNII